MHRLKTPPTPRQPGDSPDDHVATTGVLGRALNLAACLTIVMVIGCVRLLAQSPAPATNTRPTQPDKSRTEKQIEKKEQSQRLLGVLPEFGVTSRKNAPPLTPGGKFHLFYKTAFDPSQFFLIGIQSGISQAEDSFPSYGQGASGYGKRYGAALGDEVSSAFFVNFFYPTLLKEDPRYFRLGHGSFQHRFAYALAQEFIAHKDEGGRTFNFSNTLGAFSAGTLSNAYYPPEDRGVSLTLSRAAISLMYGTVGAVASEFYPDISRRWFHHRPKVPR